jgi:hypothetical protein
MSVTRKLPAGIQDFEDLRTNGYLYVDKTEYVYRLVTMGKPYFLGRPRRFGKSLFLSTLKAYFLGKKELFEGLAIAALEKEWIEYPVIYLDINKTVYKNPQSFENSLNVLLGEYEDEWKIENTLADASLRFNRLISAVAGQAGRKVVVLVDEYDKPLVNTLDDPVLNNKIRDVLKGFYGILKSADASLRFVFLTGVTKFSKVSVFSDLNHLVDISMNKQYAGICGISESELTACFQPEIQALADGLGDTYETTLAKLKKHYNGYHFAKASEGMYNPFSLLNTFVRGDFGNYWFETGTPTFLVKMLKDLDFDVKSLENGVRIAMNSITDYRAGDTNPVPLLYQSGYLTIKDYDSMFNEYILGLPNEEVKYGFFNELLPVYMPGKDVRGEFYAAEFVRDLMAGDVDGFMNRLKAFFAGIPYELNNKEEKHFQTVFFVLFRLMGQFIEAEPRSAAGRADAVVTTRDTVFVFEFKITGRSTAEKALQQIDGKGYTIPYTAGGKKIVKVGVEFSRDTRGITKWEKEEEESVVINK